MLQPIALLSFYCKSSRYMLIHLHNEEPSKKYIIYCCRVSRDLFNTINLILPPNILRVPFLKLGYAVITNWSRFDSKFGLPIIEANHCVISTIDTSHTSCALTARFINFNLMHYTLDKQDTIIIAYCHTSIMIFCVKSLYEYR